MVNFACSFVPGDLVTIDYMGALGVSVLIVGFTAPAEEAAIKRFIKVDKSAVFLVAALDVERNVSPHVRRIDYALLVSQHGVWWTRDARLQKLGKCSTVPE